MSDSYHFTVIFVINRKVIHPISSELEKSKFLLSHFFFFFLFLFLSSCSHFCDRREGTATRAPTTRRASSHFSGIRPSFIVLPEVYVSVSRASRSPTRKPSEWVKGSRHLRDQSPGRLPSRQLSGRIRSFQTHATREFSSLPR